MRLAREAGERTPPPARRETVITVLCGLNIIATPWAVGGTPLAAQWAAAAVAVAAFAFLFLPVGYDEWRSARARDSFAALVRCVPFWAGLALVSLFLIQGLNPAFTVEFEGGDWQVIPARHITWLPAGVEAPFDHKVPGGMNAFRTALMFASPWLTFCALWCGVRSRRLIRALTAAVVLSGAALAIFAVGMRSAGDATLYGTIPVSLASVVGPFRYQNQAGAFFCLMAAIGVSFTLREWTRNAEAGLHGGLHLPAAAACLLLVAGALVTASFAAFLVVAAATLVTAAATAVVARRIHGVGTKAPVEAWVVASVVALMAACIAVSGDFSGVVVKLRAKWSLASAAKLDDRAPIREATWLMYRDAEQPVWGYGAGSYRWVSPTYYARVPAFCDASGVLAARSSHAHCDWLQMLTEWGVAGLAPVAAALAAVAWRMRSALALGGAAAWPVLAGLALLALHACMDHLLFNPGVALAAVFAVFLARFLLPPPFAHAQR